MQKHLFRFHRGSLEDSLSTVKEFEKPELALLVEYLLECLRSQNRLPTGSTTENIRCEMYSKDIRPGMEQWKDTYLITSDGFVGTVTKPYPLGFTNCQFK